MKSHPASVLAVSSNTFGTCLGALAFDIKRGEWFCHPQARYSAQDLLNFADSPHWEGTDTCQMRHLNCLENLCPSRYVAWITKSLLWFLHYFADCCFSSQHWFPLESFTSLVARSEARFWDVSFRHFYPRAGVSKKCLEGEASQSHYLLCVP